MVVEFKPLGDMGPNPKQKEFLTAKQRFVAYGGSRGGGKSWAVRAKAKMLCVVNAGIKVLIIRRTLTELRENHIRPLRAEIPPQIAVYKELEKCFIFKNGSILKFGYCDSENDVLQYQGQEYDIIFLDEATQLTEFQFNTIKACNRGATQHPKRMYLTCNPGGVGHAWVKRLFIDKDYTEYENPEDYLFIPARVYDNSALMELDPEYIKNLNALPDKMRRAWLEGDWDALEGQYFNEWRNEIHTEEPFEVPTEWRRYFTMDYGLDMLAAYVIAVEPSGISHVIKEEYQSGLIISDAAARVKTLCEGEDIYAYFAPPDMWNRRQDTGKSVAEIFSENGVFLTKASNDRQSGWLSVKEALKPENVRLKVFKTCRHLIHDMPLLLHDPHRPSDAATEPHEATHAPDAIRYYFSGRPYAASIPQSGYNRKYEARTVQDEWANIFDFDGG